MQRGKTADLLSYCTDHSGESKTGIKTKEREGLVSVYHKLVKLGLLISQQRYFLSKLCFT